MVSEVLTAQWPEPPTSEDTPLPERFISVTNGQFMGVDQFIAQL